VVFVNSSAKQTTKKHEHKTNTHEGRTADESVMLLPLDSQLLKRNIIIRQIGWFGCSVSLGRCSLGGGRSGIFASAATADELQRMGELVRTGMRDGAFGLSTGSTSLAAAVS